MNRIIDETNSDDRLFFFDNYKITQLPYSGINFINKLYNELKKKNGVDEQSFNNFVMISYASDDKQYAKEIHHYLESENFIECQFDEEDINKQGLVDDELSRLISKCCAVVVVVSDAFASRQEDDPYFLKEWNLIMSQGKRVFKFFVDETDQSSLIPQKYIPKYGATIRNMISRNDFFLDWVKANDQQKKDTAQIIAEEQYQASIKNIPPND